MPVNSEQVIKDLDDLVAKKFGPFGAAKSASSHLMSNVMNLDVVKLIGKIEESKAAEEERKEKIRELRRQEQEEAINLLNAIKE